MKKSWFTWIIILAVIILAIAIIYWPNNSETPEEVAKCIGENSVLYVQLGCFACKTQEEMFGDNYQYLNSVDCVFETEKCSDIQRTPTWIIEDKKYEGVQTIEKLKELTGC